MSKNIKSLQLSQSDLLKKSEQIYKILITLRK